MIILFSVSWLLVMAKGDMILTPTSGNITKSCINHKDPILLTENRPVFPCILYEFKPDIKLSIGDQLIVAHLRFLRLEIPYFDVPLIDTPSRIEAVEKQDLDANAVKELFAYVYSQNLIVNDDNILGILRAAQFFKMDTLLSRCIEFVKRQMNDRNIALLLNFADLHNIQVLWETAEAYALQQFNNVSKTEEFLGLSSSAYLRILSSNRIRQTPETQVYESAMRWIAHNTTDREPLLFDIYEHVRFPLIDSGYFNEKILNKNFENPKFIGYMNEFRLYTNLGTRAQVEGCRIWPRTGTSKVLVVSLADFALQLFDPMTKTTTKPSKVTLSDVYSIVELNCNLYILGAKKTTEGESSTYIYNPKSGSLRTKKPMNVYRTWHSSAVLHGTIYVAGGWDINKKLLSSVESYEPFNDAWTNKLQLVSMLEKRAAHQLVAYDGCLYAIGGVNDQTLNSVEKYNVIANLWTVVEPMIEARQHFGSAVLNGKLYVGGGLTKDSTTTLDTAEVFDGKTWTKIEKMPRARHTFSLLANDGKLWAFSGKDADNKLTVIDVYDPDTGKWAESTELTESNAARSILVNF